MKESRLSDAQVVTCKPYLVGVPFYLFIVYLPSIVIYPKKDSVRSLIRWTLS
jgi:hypothetical protein